MLLSERLKRILVITSLISRVCRLDKIEDTVMVDTILKEFDTRYELNCSDVQTLRFGVYLSNIIWKDDDSVLDKLCGTDSSLKSCQSNIIIKSLPKWMRYNINQMSVDIAYIAPVKKRVMDTYLKYS